MRRLRPSDERAQLLLVGAVAIALIILGLVVVYNTILFTENQAPTQSLDDSANTGRIQAQLVEDTEKLVNYVNNDTGLDCGSAGSFETEIERHLTNSSNDGDKSLAKGLTYTAARSGVTYVTIKNADATCTGGSGSDPIDVSFDLVVRTPELDYETRIEATNVDPNP